MENSVYTPGAGTLPPVLAGRDVLLQRVGLVLHDIATVGRPRAQDIILVGPRGVGKTVTLTTYGNLAASRGFEVVNLQAVAGHAGLVESLLQRAASRIEKNVGPWTRAKKAFDRIANVSLGVGGVSAGISTHSPESGSSRLDPGTLAEALVELATEVRRDHPRAGLLITVDEMQVASAGDLALLAATLHRLNVDHPQAAVVFAGTGLPHTPAALRTAGVTHPDRLFVLEDLPVALAEIDATFAVVEAARRAGVAWHPDAAACSCSRTRPGRPPSGRGASNRTTSRRHSPAPGPRSAAAPSALAGTACQSVRWNTSPRSPSAAAAPPATRSPAASHGRCPNCPRCART